MTQTNLAKTSSLTPREIVAQLDRHIVGQTEAKKAVALALRNRWRRQQLSDQLREEVLPKNILMIGPTGVGKTEMARRLAKLADAPFIKVEATKFTEVGYVGRDVEQIIRDLVEIGIAQTKKNMEKEVLKEAELNAEEKILDVLVGEAASEETRRKFRFMLQTGELKNREVEIKVLDKKSSSLPTFDIPGLPGAQMGMVNLNEMFGKNTPQRKSKKMSVQQALKIVIEEECERLVDEDQAIDKAKEMVEQNGIVFLDEIDKICVRAERSGGDVSREGVQRDLLPLIEGTAVNTKYGVINTDHILFITSGAFHLSSPSDLLPELQGRLPNRVELSPLGAKDFIRILTETEANLIKQYEALLRTENFNLSFTSEGIEEIATLAAEINENVENIGARRLHTVLEKLLDEVSFDAPDVEDKNFEVTKEIVRVKVGELVKNTDLSKFIL